MPSVGASFATPCASRSLALPPGTPERLVAAGFRVRGAREHEKEVGKPVEIDGGERVRVRNGEDDPLGAAADRPREEEPCGALAPARQDEALQLAQARIRLVDLLLEPADRVLGDAQPLVALDPRHGEVGTEVEQLVLDPVEAARPADERVEL